MSKTISSKRQAELIKQLAEIADELGWVIALPMQEEMVPGLIIGTEEFAKEVVQAYYGEDAEMFGSNEMGNFSELKEKEKEPLQLPASKKNTTWH